MYHIKIPGNNDTGMPGLESDFGRITVVLGANGSGKSRLLDWIKGKLGNAFGEQRPVTYIEGGRVAQIPANLHFNHQEINTHRTAESALQQHRQKRTQSLSTRVRDAFITLFQREQEQKVRHSDEVTKWAKEGGNGDCPKRPEPPLDRLGRLFSSALPLLTFEFANPNLEIEKQGKKYSADKLSDGERQTLSILADVGMLAEQNSLIVVDEPELNLSALLAANLWSTIEAEYPKAVFVYATHSIPFSMRDSVDKILILSAAGAAAEIADPTKLDENELRPFLGAMPNILRGERVLVVEGSKNSFDKEFYQWIVQGTAIEVTPIGDCHAVEAASKKSGIWANTPKGPEIRGVIDRDYRADDVMNLASGVCTVLKLHEAESYLCVPQLLHGLAQVLKLVDPVPTEDELLNRILTFASKRIIPTAAKRSFNKLDLRLGPSVANTALDKVEDVNKIIEMLTAAASAEAERAKTFLSPAAIEKVFRTELQQCQQAVDAKNLENLLRLFPGKELLFELARHIGLKDAQMIVTATRAHLKAEMFEFTKELQGQFPKNWIAIAKK